MASRTRTSKETKQALTRGLSKGGTYRFTPEIALELEVYGLIKRHGSQREIIEQSLDEFFRKNPIPKKLRDAAMTVLEGAE